MNWYPWLDEAWQRWQGLQARLGHAYLISGAQGMGLDTLVYRIVQQQFCDHGNACGQCSGCHLFNTRQHPDYYQLKVLEDKKEISVDQVRELINKLSETAHQGGYKVVWVDAPEKLNASAFNALLKTLEEPAEKTLFLLTTYRIGQLPATVVSRCQPLSVTFPSWQETLPWLQQQYPQLDERLLKRALKVNWGAPIQAHQWIESGWFEQYNQWQTDIKQIAQGQKSPVGLVAAWLKWDFPESVLDYFYQWSVSQVRNLMYQADSKADLNVVQNALRFQQACLWAKQSWQGNANKNLVLETLCLEWLESQQTDRYRSIFEPGSRKRNSL